MRFNVRYTKGLGNSAVYVRLRDGAGNFWNFVTLAWVNPEVANCRLFLTELTDSDPQESLYVNSANIPSGGPYIQEAVDVSSSYVIAYDDNVMGELTGGVGGSDSWIEKLELVFQYFGFKRETAGTGTSGTETLYDEAGTSPVAQANLSDTGSTFTKDKLI